MPGLTARLIARRPDPFEIAALLRNRPGFALVRCPDRRLWYAAAEPIEEAHDLDPEPGLALCPHASDLFRAPRWIGVVPYEARRTLERGTVERRDEPDITEPVWLRYPALVEIGERVRVIGDDPARVAALAKSLTGTPAGAPLAELRPRGSPEVDSVHAERVRAALEHIAKGDVYVVNLARLFRFEGSGDPLAHLLRMWRRVPAPFAAALALPNLDVISSSPELLLRTHPDGRVATRPIKGTRPRGFDRTSDDQKRHELEHDPKERAELAMVVDVERNDLGRIARPASVRQLGEPAVHTHATVHHRSVELVAHMRPNITRAELFRALVPSGSVTGAPKVRAMELIRDLEAERRGLYTGAIGFVAHDGSVELSMAIRTLTLRAGEGRYFAGGGIVADSDPEREVEETLWKALQVLG